MTNATSLLKHLDKDAIQQRLEEIESERKALMVLLRLPKRVSVGSPSRMEAPMASEADHPFDLDVEGDIDSDGIAVIAEMIVMLALAELEEQEHPQQESMR